MASYAALLSLMHTIHHLKNHPRPPISLDQKQVDSLLENITHLQNFLQLYPSSDSKEDDDLEKRISGAAYAAEDVIESHIVDQIHSQSNITTEDGSRIMDQIHTDLYRGLERVIQDMDLIKGQVMEIIQQKMIMTPQHHPHLHTNSSVSTSSGGPAASKWRSSITPVFDEVLTNKVLDKLTGQQCGLQIIPIVGMGGIGKTTFATSLYTNPLIVQHFDIRAWVTISQEYSKRNILQLLCEDVKGKIDGLSEMSEDEIGVILRKQLWGRRYVIVMDDIWSVEAWDQVKSFFPDDNNGSRIMITTRRSNLAFELSGSQGIQVNFLDENKSWGLLCETVFGKELGCPIQLENIGREIARKCRGLPLSIVVIGGLLKKSNRTRAHWEYTLQNLNLLINLEEGEYCLQILRASYKELPIRLKPCFLYMGIFREEQKMRVTKLIELWVAEGILQPSKDKRLEEVAEEYINELIERNLIFVDKLRWNGKAKICKIHDLLRDLCLREAEKQSFLCVLKHQRDLNIPQCMNMERRIGIHYKREDEYSPAWESASLTRSLKTIGWPEVVQLRSLGLLRVYSGDYYFHFDLASVEAVLKKANLRFLNIVLSTPQLSRFPSSWFLLWNLQTLKVVIPASWGSIIAPSEIWEMPLLRQVMIKNLQLPDPLCGENDLILEDLQKLSCISNLKCSAAVIKGILNIKTLKLNYQMSCGEAEYHNFGLNNIGHLTKLQSLNLLFDCTAISDGEIFQCYLVQNLSFPHSLKKLTLAVGGLIRTPSDALPFLKNIKDTFKYQREKYEGFVGVMRDYEAQRIDKDGLRRAVKALFRGHPTLILWFNTIF